MDKKLLEDFMRQLQCGDMNALNGIYAIMSKPVYLLSLSILRNEEKAKDIMQETFIKAVANINLYKLDTNASAWISKIARNMCYKDYNKSQKTMSIELFDGNLGGDVDMSEKWDDNILLYKAMKMLNVNEREIVMMFAVEGYKHREIAEIVEKPMGTVQWTYNNAIKKLKKHLQNSPAVHIKTADKNTYGADNKKGGAVYEK